MPDEGTARQLAAETIDRKLRKGYVLVEPSQNRTAWTVVDE
jgi:transcription antitermination factor NusG